MALILEIKGDSKKFRSEVARVAKETGAKVKGLEKTSVSSANRMKTAFGGVGKALGMLGIGAGIGIAITGMKRLITEQIASMDAMTKYSKATGLTTEFISGMGFAAERSGSSLKSVQVGMRGLIRSMQDVKDGLLEGTRKFEQLGVSVLDTNGNLRKSEDVFLEIANKISLMSNETEKAALSQEIFGRSGIELIPLLNEGASGIEKLTSKARELGIVFDKEAGAKAEEAADAMTNFNTATTGMGRNLAVTVMPTITAFLNTMADLGKVSIVKKLQQEQIEFNALIGILQNTNTEQDTRNKTINKLQEQYPDYIKNINLEKAGIEDIAKMQKEANQAFMDKIKLAAAEEKLIAIRRRGVDAAVKLFDAELELGKKYNVTREYAIKLAESGEVISRKYDQEKARIQDVGTELIRYTEAMNASSKEEKVFLSLLKELDIKLDDLSTQALPSTITDIDSLTTSTKALNSAFFAIQAPGIMLGRGMEAYGEQLTDTIIKWGIITSKIGGAGGKTGDLVNETGDLVNEQKKYEASKQRQIDLEKQATNEKKASIREVLGLVVSAGERQNAIVKAALIAQASMYTYAAANRALGSLPPPFSFIAAGVAVAAGLANVKKIASFAEGGRPPVGRASIVGERGPEMFVPDRPGTIYNQQQIGGSTLTFNFNMADEFTIKNKVIPIINKYVTRQGGKLMASGVA